MFLICRPQIWDRFNFIIFYLFLFLFYLIYFPDFGLFWKKNKNTKGKVFFKSKEEEKQRGEKQNNYF